VREVEQRERLEVEEATAKKPPGSSTRTPALEGRPRLRVPSPSPGGVRRRRSANGGGRDANEERTGGDADGESGSGEGYQFRSRATGVAMWFLQEQRKHSFGQ